MSQEQKPNVRKKFGSSLLEGAQDLKKAPKPQKKAPQIRVARSAYLNMVTTRILKGVLAAVAVFVILYFIFAATIMRVLPTTSAGLLPVKNITFEGGLVPPGELVVVSMTKAQGQEFTDYLTQAIVPQGGVSVVKVLAGPWGTFGWAEPGIVAVNGELADILMNKPEDTELTNEYLVECIRGACVPGEGYVLSADNLMGIPLVKE